MGEVTHSLYTSSNPLILLIWDKPHSHIRTMSLPLWKKFGRFMVLNLAWPLTLFPSPSLDILGHAAALTQKPSGLTPLFLSKNIC